MENTINHETITETVRRFDSTLLESWGNKNKCNPATFADDYGALSVRLNKFKMFFYFSALMSMSMLLYSVYLLFSYNLPAVEYFLGAISILVVVSMPTGVALWNIDSKRRELVDKIRHFFLDVKALDILSNKPIDKEKIYKRGFILAVQAIQSIRSTDPDRLMHSPHTCIIMVYQELCAYRDFAIHASKFGIVIGDDVISNMIKSSQNQKR